jgi:uncharacterized protein YdbL (DUF1318 family)
MPRSSILVPLAISALTGCTTHVIVEQPKPLDININFTGHLDLVIHDARDNLEQITGEKPTNVVRPEDLGLPPGTTPGATAPTLPDPALADSGWESSALPVIQRNTAPRTAPTFPIATEADLNQAMAARNPQIQSLWANKLVGEAHTGLLVPRANLTPDQQALVDAENKDRTALYTAEAQRRKITPDEVALGYLLARLGYAKPGAWYEKLNTQKQWEWKQWGQ